SVCDRYHPTVDEFLEHVAEVRERSGWDESLVRTRVERVRAIEGGFEVQTPNPPSDTLSLGKGGVFDHVLLAPGHPALAFPPELEDDPRAVHAYRPHEYGDEVEIVGAGMAAATEWLNALAAGARVISVRRREPERRRASARGRWWLGRPGAGFARPGAHRRDAHARARGGPGAVGVSRRGHDRRREVRRARLPQQDGTVSYTLRGRIESRLAAVLV